MVFVQYGAGWSAGDGWLNFDASPSLWLQRLPLIGRFIKIDARRFPEAMMFGDIIRGLPLQPGSAQAVYASHVLEHLSLSDLRTALRNTFDAMAPGGTFRLIVPDLQVRAQRYLDAAQRGDYGAATRFMREACLGSEQRPRGLRQTIRAALGNSAHLWMWDEPSMRRELEDAGFVSLRRCAFGDSSVAAFSAVESEDRFIDEDKGYVEVALECQRPA